MMSLKLKPKHLPSKFPAKIECHCSPLDLLTSNPATAPSSSLAPNLITPTHLIMVSPTLREPENDLDEALEAIFDAPPTPIKIPNQDQSARPSAPSTPPPTSIPQTPEPSPKKQTPKSILEHLADNQKRLSAGAARILQDLSKLTEENQPKHDYQSSSDTHPPVTEPQQLRPKTSTIAEDMAARRTKKKKQPTKNAFAVIGRENRPDGVVNEMINYQYVDHKITNMSLTETPYKQSRLEAIFEHTPRLDIADIKSRYEEIHTGALKDYTVFGCLVKKIFKKSARNGKMYAVWSLCNMPRGKHEGRDVESTVVRLLVFDDAYETFHTRCEGTVFALRKPGLLPRRDDNDEKLSQHALRISKKGNIVVLGVCKDFKLCEVRRPGGELCGQWYDANRTTYCTTHTLKRRKAWTTGTRMDIQNAVRPHIRDPTQGLRAPTDISAMRSIERESMQTGELDRKRKRDSLLARGLKRNKQVSTRKTPEVLLPNVQDGVRKHATRPDPMANVARDVRQVRNQYGKRHARLLGHSDRQSRYHDACEILYGLGFKLKADGGWEPPDRCDVALVTTNTHQFSGLGKIKRRRAGELGNPRQENEAPSGKEKNKAEACATDNQENGEIRDSEKIAETEDAKMEEESKKGSRAAIKSAPAISLLRDETASTQEVPKAKMDCQPASDEIRSSLVTPSVSNDVIIVEGETVKMAGSDANNGASRQTLDAPQESSVETRVTPQATIGVNLQEDANDIILSDESEDD